MTIWQTHLNWEARWAKSAGKWEIQRWRTSRRSPQGNSCNLWLLRTLLPSCNSDERTVFRFRRRRDIGKFCHRYTALWIELSDAVVHLDPNYEHLGNTWTLLRAYRIDRIFVLWYGTSYHGSRSVNLSSHVRNSEWIEEPCCRIVRRPDSLPRPPRESYATCLRRIGIADA